MVREGYGTSGEGNGTTVGHLKVGTGEVLPLLARDPNYSSVPGSDAEPRLSDAGSGNEGPKKAARGRASLHGEVLIANKTLKKKPYKSLGWSLIAVRALPPFVRLFLGHRRHRANPRTPGSNRPIEVKHPLFLSNAPMPSARARPRGRRAPARLLLSEASSRSTFLPHAASPDPASAPTRRVPDSPPPPSLALVSDHPFFFLNLVDALVSAGGRFRHPGRLHGGRRGGPLQQHRALARRRRGHRDHLQRAHGRFR
jgi:hypothetical protein